MQYTHKLPCNIIVRKHATYTYKKIKYTRKNMQYTRTKSCNIHVKKHAIYT